jgi:hypothetical protein
MQSNASKNSGRASTATATLAMPSKVVVWPFPTISVAPPPSTGPVPEPSSRPTRMFPSQAATVTTTAGARSVLGVLHHGTRGQMRRAVPVLVLASIQKHTVVPLLPRTVVRSTPTPPASLNVPASLKFVPMAGRRSGHACQSIVQTLLQALSGLHSW